MIYRILFILVVMLAPGSRALSAETDRYRVEIIVLSHLEHDQQAREVSRLEDFSPALDFLTPPAEDAEEEEVTTAAAATEQGPAADSDPLLLEDTPVDEEDALNAVIHVEQLGPEMQDAWRRLHLSGPFRPLQYLAWEQGSNAPFPSLRLHDLEVVLVEDPWAAERLAAAEAPSDVAAMPEGMEAEETLPDPTIYYRLDGTARLSRLRFLHLALAVEWRVPLFDASLPARGMPSGPSAGAEELPGEPSPSGFLVHRLEQSRPVRTGRMEYFDGPVLGVLAWVSRVPEPPEDSPVD